jgi:hypothetical protein
MDEGVAVTPRTRYGLSDPPDTSPGDGAFVPHQFSLAMISPPPPLFLMMLPSGAVILSNLLKVKLPPAFE